MIHLYPGQAFGFFGLFGLHGAALRGAVKDSN